MLVETLCEKTEWRPALVPIKSGGFLMGSTDKSFRAKEEEGPPHKVTISRPFAMAATPVTQDQWQSVMRFNPSGFQQHEGHGEHPVEMVSWFDAVAYCNALSRKEELEEAYVLKEQTGEPGTPDFWSRVEWKGLDCTGYRLPTEAEWEYACRAGTTTALYSGGLSIVGERNAPELDPISWYGGNSGAKYEGGYDSPWTEMQYPAAKSGTHPVGQKKANPWGLFDMLGNVWEWCWDFRSDCYGAAAVVDPTGPTEISERVYRGGSWYVHAHSVRCAVRSGRMGGERDDSVGFRPVRLLE